MNKRKEQGFTLVELILVVALVSILGSVSTIAVWQYNRKMTQLEYDGYAKELFMAAQNHLTMAEEQGFLGFPESAFGSDGNLTEDDKNIHYFVVSHFPEESSVLYQMLPFGSIDEKVRKGNYIIRYQTNPAWVLDVFYSGYTGKYAHEYSSSEYSDLVNNYRGEDKRLNRRSDRSYVIGWYGGEGAESIEPIDLAAPSIKLVNDEQLYLELTNPNKDKTAADYALRVIVEGKTSGKQVSMTIKDMYKTASDKMYIVFDDISQSGFHFKDIFSGTDALPFDVIYTIDGDRELIPGEDISVYATVFSTTKLSGVKNSATSSTNSLFESVSSNKANISCMRHLENLGTTVSGCETIQSAEQKSNLDWNQYKKKVNSLKKHENSFYDTTETDEKIFYTGEIIEGEPFVESTKNGTYAPIQTDKITYDGKKHSISNVVIDSMIPSGMFSELEESSLSNLKIINFSVKSTDKAGLLVGTMEDTAGENLVAYHTTTVSQVEGTDAGGLIGSMKGGTLTKSSASVIVKGTNAGGLIGTADDVEVEQCYSGGHTENGRYSTTSYNVTATGYAGGLVGTADGDFSMCYSTCSAKGNKDGGFAGSLTGSATNCYTTGLSTWGFSETTATLENCYYFSLVNKNAKGDTNNVSKPFDQTIGEMTAVDVWNSFTQYPDEKNADPYDETLEGYDGKYLFRTVFQLKHLAPDELDTEEDEAGDDFVKVHYGDWPSLETEVVNTKI